MKRRTSLTIGSSASNATLSTLHYRKTAIIWYSVTTVVGIFGACINLLVLLVILSQKRLRSASGILITNLILIYFVISSVHFPIGNLMVIGTEYRLNILSGQCKYVHFFYLLTFVAGNYADTVLALNRVVAICFPHHYSPLTSRKVIWLQVATSWFIGICVAVYMFFGGSIDIVASPTGLCAFKYASPMEASFITVIITYIPYTLIGTSAVAIFTKIVYVRVQRNTHVAVIAQRRVTMRDKLLFQRRLTNGRMLLGSFVWCFMCNLPTVVVVSLPKNLQSADPFLGLWLRMLLVCQFTVNPAIFIAMNEDYRHGVARLFGLGRHSRDSNIKSVFSHPAETVPSNSCVCEREMKSKRNGPKYIPNATRLHQVESFSDSRLQKPNFGFHVPSKELNRKPKDEHESH